MSPTHLDKNIFSDTDKIDFTDKVAVITGAGRGLGKIYALELSKRGAKVVVNDCGSAIDGSCNTSTASADKVVSEIIDCGNQAVTNYDSVATSQGGANIIQTAINKFGTIDILINNAGILRDKTFGKMTIDDWNSVLAVHLNGAYNVTRPAFEIMKRKGYGKIIMTSSAAGLYGNFGQVNYASAKMGLVGMMNSLKIEGKRYNINVNTIAPISASRLTKGVIPKNLFDKAKPNLVASLVLYLCSDKCGDTGGVYNVGMGYVNRVSVMTNPWVKISNNDYACTPEDVSKCWSNIHDMQGAMEFEDLLAAFLDLMTVMKK